MFLRKSFFLVLFLFQVIYTKAQTTATAGFDVHVRMDYAPSVLNPVTFQDENAEQVLRLIYQPLIAIDPTSLSPVPVLVDSLPVIETDSTGRLLMTFKVRPEAKWDNGRNIVARDVEFSVKAMLCPNIRNDERRRFVDMLVDCRLYFNDPRKFTLVFQNYSFELYDILYDLFIIDPYFYDPANYLQTATISELKKQSKLEDINQADKKYLHFASKINFKIKDQEFIKGSGPYTIELNDKNDDIKLVRKAKWWGDKINSPILYFKANPKEIYFHIIEEEIEVLKQLANNKLDVVAGLSTEATSGLKESRQGFQKYYFANSPEGVFEYLGLNTRSVFLKDRRVRQALAYLVDYNKIMSDIVATKARRINSPVAPEMKLCHDVDIPLYTYDQDKALELLKQAGWKDSNEDGWLDKNESGKNVTFRLNYFYNNNYPTRKLIGEMFKSTCKQVGIDITVQGYSPDLFQYSLNHRKFDIYAGGWFAGHTLMDPTVIWGSENIPPRGFNFCGYNNPECDTLMQELRTTIEPVAQGNKMKALEKVLHDDQPFIFLYTPMVTTLISKRFLSYGAIPTFPGYWLGSFTLRTSGLDD